MVGVLIITHGNLGNELISAAELIKGKFDGVLSISIDSGKSLEDIKKEITGAIRKVEKGKGVLILTDLFGGTPSNISLSFLKEGKIEVVTGVNLPMMLKLDLRKDKDLQEFSSFIRDYGRKNISLASEILKREAVGK